LKISLGGRLGPFRAGVSTRGAGVGFGPLSAGSGRRRRKHGSSGGVGNVRFGIAFLVLLWPMIFALPALEVPWLVMVGLYVLVARKRSRTQSAVLAVETAAVVREGLIRRYERSIANGKHVLACIDANPEGYLDERLKPAERLMGAFADVSLIEPRVVSPGGPRVQQAVDMGKVLVTDRGLSYFSPDKRKEWLWSQTSEMTVDKGRLMFVMKNRTTVTGIEPQNIEGLALYGAAVWGRGLAAGTPIDLTVTNLSAAILGLENGLRELTGPAAGLS
jgi:hypothetical protein